MYLKKMFGKRREKKIQVKIGENRGKLIQTGEIIKNHNQLISFSNCQFSAVKNNYSRLFLQNSPDKKNKSNNN